MNTCEEDLNGLPEQRKNAQATAEKVRSNTVVSFDELGNKLSRFIDATWDFSCHVRESQKHKSKMRFCYDHDTNLGLEHRLIVYGLIYTPMTALRLGKVLSLSTIYRHCGELSLIVSTLSATGLVSIKDLNCAESFRSWVAILKDKGLSKTSLKSLLGIFKKMFRLRNWLGWTVELPTDLSMDELASTLAAPTKRHKNQTYAIPSRIQYEIYGEAITQVEYWHDRREKLGDLMLALRQNTDQRMADYTKQYFAAKRVNRRISHEPSICKITGKFTFKKNYFGKCISSTAQRIVRKYQQDDMERWDAEKSLTYNINSILAQCAIVLGGFSGMRPEEIINLQEHSFVRRELGDHTLYSLHANTFKMEQGKHGRREEWLCAPICEKAIDVALAVTSGSRHRLRSLAQDATLEENRKRYTKRSRYLFIHPGRHDSPIIYNSDILLSILKKHHKKVRINAGDIREFSLLNPMANPAYNDVSEGKLWPLKGHQFRRSFAVFSLQHELCTRFAIKQQFKQVMLRMTDWYCNGALTAKLNQVAVNQEMKKAINETTLIYKTAKLLDYHKSDTTLSGGKGRAIASDRGNPLIVPSYETIYSDLKNGRLTLHGTLFSYCTAHYHCAMSSVTNPSSCINCSDAIIDSEHAERWRHRLNWLQREIKKLGSVRDSLYSHLITQYRAAEGIVKHFNIESDETINDVAIFEG